MMLVKNNNMKFIKMKKLFIISIVMLMIVSCTANSNETDGNVEVHDTVEASDNVEIPDVITIENIAQNPEGIEYDKNDHTFFLSSLNAGPIIKVNLDGTFTPFTSGEQFPLSTAGLQIDYERNRLLAAGFNGLELFDEDPTTKGTAYLRVYNLETGVIEQDINLSSLLPDAGAYFANDIAVDNDGNAYISDWFAGVIYKVDLDGNPTVFWSNTSGIPGGPNGLDFHPDGYLLVSVINDGTYSEYGLVKIPVNDADSAINVDITDSEFSGFDGMVVTPEGNVIGVTNNGESPGGNVLVELSSEDAWESAGVENSKAITTSTTVAITPEEMNYVINQDFSSDSAESCLIKNECILIFIKAFLGRLGGIISAPRALLKRETAVCLKTSSSLFSHLHAPSIWID